jgi:hypothetical protein
MDVSALTAFLAPVLPYLLRAGEAATKQAASRFGDATWERARRLWARLRPQVEETPRAQEAVDEVAAAPDDARLRGALEVQLERLLAADAELAADVRRLWQDVVEAGAAPSTTVIVSGERAVGAGRDISGVAVTGEDAVLDRTTIARAPDPED